jgi:hypothetical protein
MVWRIFATKLETAETMEDADLLHARIVFLPDKGQLPAGIRNNLQRLSAQGKTEAERGFWSGA